MFIAGLILGLASSLLVGGLLGLYAYKRLLLLERRTRHAERLAELGTLTGGLAHEIKNPLSTVQLNLQLLQEDVMPENPAYARIISRINTVKNETSRLRDILDDFLRYAGRLELDRKPVDLNQVLEDLVDFYAPQAQANRVQLRLKKSSTPVIAQVDSKLIKQTILNMMINATQAMQRNGGEMILTLSSTPTDAMIDVIDTGDGISPEAVEKVFQAYYSTKRGGTGLGLPMSRRIAEEHGGTLRVRSEAGKGSDFTLQLPLGNDAASVEPERQPARAGIPRASA